MGVGYSVAFICGVHLKIAVWKTTLYFQVKQEQAKKEEKVEPEVVPKDEEEEKVEKPMETGELIVNEVGEDITDK